MRASPEALGFLRMGGSVGPGFGRSDHQSRCFALPALNLGDRIVDGQAQFDQRDGLTALRKAVLPRAGAPMIDDSLHNRVLRLDRTDDEIATQAIRPRTASDVVNVQVGDGRGDLFALPVEDGVVDEGAVNGGHGGGLTTGAVPASVSVSVPVTAPVTESVQVTAAVSYAPPVFPKYPLGVLWVCALVFLITGGLFTVTPQEMFAPIGIEVPDGSPLTELRAMYGGLEVAIGVFLLLCARRRGVALELGLVLSFLLFSGLAAYRGIGMGVDGPQVAFMSGLLILEAGGAMFALSGLVVLARGAGATSSTA